MSAQTPSMPTAAPRSPIQTDEIDLGRLLAILWLNKFLVMGCAALVGIIGICYALIVTPVYRADALIQVEDGQSGPSLVDADLSMLLGVGQASSSDTQSEILKSRMIMGRAAEQVGLDIVVEPVYMPLLGKALTRYGVTRPGFLQGSSSVWAEESIYVSELSVFDELMRTAMEEGPFIVRTLTGNSYQLQHPDGSILGQGITGQLLVIGNSLLEIFISEINAPPNAEFKVIKRSYEGATRYLQEGFTIAEQGIETGILRLSVTGENQNEIVRSLDAINQVYLVQNINRQAAEAESRLNFLEEQTPLIQDNLIASENRLNDYRTTQESVDLTLETMNVLGALVEIEGQINELELQEAELAKNFTPSHPAYKVILEKKAQMEREHTRLNALVGDLPETQQEVLRLTRDVEVNQEIYMQILNSMQELRIAKAGTIGSVRILDNALIAEESVSPKRRIIVLISVVLGMMLSLAIVMIRMMLHRGVSTVEQVMEVGLPVYATIPLSEQQNKLSPLSRKKSKEAKFNGVLAHTNPTDLAIEALRSLRTSLHFAMLEADNNILMLTGSSPEVGKSFVSENLAMVCAQGGQLVLLIDADLRRGHIHQGFSGKGEEGLSDLLSGKIDLASAIRSTKESNLSYISRGQIPPNPSELLMSQQFSELLNTLSAQYDLIIIDTPPILAVTDAAIVGKQVGATLMVVRFEETAVKELERAKEQLEITGITVKGAVLNAVTQTSESYSYNYAYDSAE